MFKKIIIGLGLVMFISCRHAPQQDFSLKWETLPAIPDTIGFAGSYSGVANDALVVAGGANFPDGGAPWKGAKKVWHDDIFILEKGDKAWKRVGHLPQAAGYGVSVTWKDGLIIAGGGNASTNLAEVWYLRYQDKEITFQRMPDLPQPIANACGIVVSDVLYIMGGTTSPRALSSAHNFWTLDLNQPNQGWQVLEAWPGPSRMLAVAAAVGEELFLFSGTQLKEGKRTYLKDAYRYHSTRGWDRIAPLPQSVVAAPSPAYAYHQQLLIFGGDDGALANEQEPDLAQHPGFSKTIWAYDVEGDTWKEAGILPDFPAVTTPLVYWNHQLVIPGGEIKPSVRTPRVLAGTIVQKEQE
ncbi:hypothetical protein GCM10023231_26790 [Olivibacter ginsenosidimutans]|uniref:Galactose oxidase n=1 Tax=Olivibacter ginsenosidimutans TaxID=1176537 RepID=A0ABP9BL11_9SPHI